MENVQKYVIEAITAISEAEKDSDDEDSKKSPAAASEPKPANPIRKGFLTKQVGKGKAKKRWFVLDATKLVYYKGNEVCLISSHLS